MPPAVAAAKRHHHPPLMVLMLRHHKDGVEIIDGRYRLKSGSACGLLKGDTIIKAIDGMVIESPDQLNAILASKGNNRVQLLIQRGQKIGQIVF